MMHILGQLCGLWRENKEEQKRRYLASWNMPNSARIIPSLSLHSIYKKMGGNTTVQTMPTDYIYLY